MVPKTEVQPGTQLKRKTENKNGSFRKDFPNVDIDCLGYHNLPAYHGLENGNVIVRPLIAEGDFIRRFVGDHNGTEVVTVVATDRRDTMGLIWISVDPGNGRSCRHIDGTNG